jgi:predicted TIM-barrel fold metal-dependent hydrolase
MSANLRRLADAEVSRRHFLRGTATGAAALAAAGATPSAVRTESVPIIDSHLHVWDLKQFHLPWLDHNIPLLHRDYSLADYHLAAEGLNISAAVYVEVNVEPGQRANEAEYMNELCARSDSPVRVGVVAGDPRATDFEQFIAPFGGNSPLQGVRFLYPPHACDDTTFISGMRALGKRRMTFDLQLSPDLLADAARTVEQCPDTQFILDHCGGTTPQFFRRDAENEPQARRHRETWRKGIEQIAGHANVACKISGVADSALPSGATVEDIAPIIHFCLDRFGPDRVLFGGNWPVCLKGTTLGHWVRSLKTLVASRSQDDNRKLFFDNAERLYRLMRTK